METGEIETFFLPVVYLCILRIDQVDRSRVMRCKKAYLVVNPRAGQNLAKITDVIAVLALIDSEMHKVDIGRVEVEGLTFPDAAQNGGQQANGKNGLIRKVQAPPWAKHHFLLTSGLGFDASVIGSTPRPLKYQVGRLAFGVAAAQKLQDQHAF